MGTQLPLSDAATGRPRRAALDTRSVRQAAATAATALSDQIHSGLNALRDPPSSLFLCGLPLAPAFESFAFSSSSYFGSTNSPIRSAYWFVRSNRGEFLECFHPPKTIHRPLSSAKRQM